MKEKKNDYKQKSDANERQIEKFQTQTQTQIKQNYIIIQNIEHKIIDYREIKSTRPFNI